MQIKKENFGEEEAFVFPSNIKQMGSPETGMRIYMEDYVHTYLYQYAKSDGGKEKLAVLVGRYIEINGEKVVVISGAIQGKDTAVEKGVEVFAEESWEYIHSEIEKYFSGLYVVGWVHSQPGYGAFLMARDEVYHRENFKEGYQVLYVLDPMEKMDAFFIYNEEKDGIRGAKGYFIYYEKNERMQDYMLDNAVVKSKGSRFMIVDDGEEWTGFDAPKRIDAAGKIRELLGKKDKPFEIGKYGAFVGVAGVFLVVMFLMGAGLLRSQDRIKDLESKVTMVQDAYTAISREIGEGKVSAAFAASGEAVAPEPGTEADDALKASEAEVAAATEPEPTEATEAEATEAAAAVQSPKRYIVQEGDSLGYISYKFYGTYSRVEELAEANGLSSPDRIYYGKELIIP